MSNSSFSQTPGAKPHKQTLSRVPADTGHLNKDKSLILKQQTAQKNIKLVIAIHQPFSCMFCVYSTNCCSVNSSNKVNTDSALEVQMKHILYVIRSTGAHKSFMHLTFKSTIYLKEVIHSELFFQKYTVLWCKVLHTVGHLQWSTSEVKKVHQS